MESLSKEFQFLVNNFSQTEIEKQWNEKVKTTFDKYMSIPNLSPAFDVNWKENGYIDEVILLFEDFAKTYAPKSSIVKVQNIEGKTPLLIVDIPARNYENDDVILVYGHSDKQPPMENWREGLEPFKANYEGSRLYGRGGADDGYAIFSSLLAISFIDDSQLSHARIVLIIEASEESGSPDLMDHLEKINSSLDKELGEISLVVCLDSGAIDFEHLWITQSLRGLLQVNVEIRVLDQATHSGGAGGIAPSAFHVFRQLIDRVAMPGSGEILLPELHAPIPEYIVEGAKETAELMGSVQAHGISFAHGVHPIFEKVQDQLIANTFKPALEIIGINGLPKIENAGNVLRDSLSFALSFRLPPEVDPLVAASAVARELNRDTPFNAQVSVVVDSLAQGWLAPKIQPWLSNAFEKFSNAYFNDGFKIMGEGGTIPFMSMLGKRYPQAQFMVTGVLGPNTNAHGPNEFLDLPTAHRISGVLAGVIVEHGNRETR